MNIRVPSDDLHRIRELFLNWAPLFGLLELLPQLRLVIDANVVIEEILFVTGSRKNASARTYLQEAVDSGAVVALAPPKLREEIDKHIPALAAKRRVSEEALRRAWLECSARIRFVEVGPISAGEVAAAADPDDLPYVYLYRQVDADAVVSRDRHIAAMGAVSVRREALIHVRDYAREKAPEVMLRVGSYVVTVPVAAGLFALWKIVSGAAKGFARLPPAAQLALLLGGAAVVAHPRSRKALSEFFSIRATRLKEPAWEVLNVLGTLASEWQAAEMRVRARQEAVERSIPRAAKRPLRLVARSICLQSGRPLTVKELAHGVLRAGYETKSADIKPYLLRTLRQEESFVSTPDGRWTVIVESAEVRIRNRKHLASS